MNTIKVTLRDQVAILSLDRGRSNAINKEMVEELRQMIRNAEADDQVTGMILTGKDGFFSAGVDLIELYDYDEEQIREFWNSFISLTSALASFKKPLIAAINGHSPAGGCVLAICSDYRIMADGKYIIGLNEVPVGIIVPGSIFHLYAFWLGTARASRFLLEGRLLGPADALQAGLVDEVVAQEVIITSALRQMKKYSQYSSETWQQSKLSIRKELLGLVNADQAETLDLMLKQWWSPQTRAILQTIIKNLKASPEATRG